jgi:hypothetical protein
MAVPPCQKPARPNYSRRWAFGPVISSSRRVGILANVSNPMLTATLPQLRSVAERARRIASQTFAGVAAYRYALRQGDAMNREAH